MIPKKENDLNVERLRTILLMAADFNHNNKRAGRDVMKNAEKHRTIAREQYGSRRNHAAIDHCTNKRLTFDLLRQKRQPGGHMATDAVSCYDRIVHSVASLCMQRQGMPLGPIICMMTTLQNMKHRIRTIYGDSEDHFDAADSLYGVPLGQAQPIQGVGQGNGASPQIWAVVSSPMLEVLRAEGYQCIFKLAISGEEVTFVGYAFVDDADTITSGAINDTPQKIMDRMQQTADTFEGVTSASGGAFSPEKTFWYLVAFKWTHGEWKYTTATDNPGELTMRDKNGQRVALKRLEVWEAERTLGVRLAPDGNNKMQYEFMLKTAKEWASLIRAGHLPRQLNWQSLNTAIMKTLTYPLAATTLTTKQCKNILKPIIKAGLSSSGTMPTLPRALVHAPIMYHGYALTELYAEQGIQQIQKILRFSTSKALTGELI